MSGSLTTHVASSSLSIGLLAIRSFKKEFYKALYLPFTDHIVDSLGDAVGVVIQTEVTEQHGSRQDHGAGVGLVLALDVKTDVAATGLEDGNVTTHVAAGNHTGAANKGSADVGEDASVKVGHDHHVELLGARHSLHGSIVHNHIVHLEGGVVLSDLVESAAEETIGQLHDVGLVNAGNLLPVVGESEAEGELGDTLGLGAGDDLEGLDHALDRLVLEAGVLALGVLTDDAEVDVLVAGVVSGDVLDQGDRGVDVELLAQGDVEGLVAGALNGGEKNTLQTQLVALQRSNRLLEQFLRVLVAGVDTTDIHLLPLDRDVVGLEDGLDGFRHFGTNSVT